MPHQPSKPRHCYIAFWGHLSICLCRRGGHSRTAFVLCRRRRCTGPPFLPSAVPSAFRHWLWCSSCVWMRLQPVCLVAAWYGFAVAPRRTSSDHALHVCATGAITSCAPRWCALGKTRSGLPVLRVWHARSHILFLGRLARVFVASRGGAHPAAPPSPKHTPN
jgi:hypothetical protein